MSRSAVIVAVSAEERRTIAQLIKPTELFRQVHFCSNLQEARFLLEHSPVAILFSDACSPGQQSLRLTAGLNKLAEEFQCQLVFFSHLDADELTLLGVLPHASQCLGYDLSHSTIASFLKRLLSQQQAVPARGGNTDQLIDRSSGVYNRFYFDAFLDQELSRSKLTGRPFSLLLIEPAEQREAPRSQGWAGLLPSIAVAIKNQIRTSDLLCRIETRRLALLLPETTGSNAKRVMLRIQNKARELAREFPIDLKIGLVSPNLSQPCNRHGLLLEAEAAL